jgi:hypothetical protein
VKTWPARLIVPEREAVLLFASMPKATVPLPLPELLV